MNPALQIIPYHSRWRQKIIDLWERSVGATHGFLRADDFSYIKSIVEHIDFESLSVYCLVLHDELLGFTGVSGNTIEMLFVDPVHIGRGYGKKLIQMAIYELGATCVDVNEQNETAVGFYKHMGFVVYQRDEYDSTGKHYPILKMKLASAM